MNKLATLFLSVLVGFAFLAHTALAIGEDDGPTRFAAAPSLAKDIAGMWSLGQNHPQAQGYTCGAALDGVIYTFCGLTSSAVTNTAYKYTIATNTWTQIAAPPEARVLAHAEAVNGKIYILGGWSSTSPWKTEGSVLEYDPAANSYTRKAVMPVPVFGGGSFVYNGKIFILGGGLTSYQTQTDAVQIYDVATDTWTQSLLPIPRAMRGMDAGIVGSTAYLVGGYWYASGGQLTADVYKGTVADDGIQWTKIADFPGGAIMRYYLGQNGEKVFLTGGIDAVAWQGGALPTKTWSLDPASDTWTGEAMKPTASFYGTPFIYDGSGKFYAICGQGASAYTSGVEIFDAAAASVPAGVFTTTSYERWCKKTVEYTAGFGVKSIGAAKFEWDAVSDPNAPWLMVAKGHGEVDPGASDVIPYYIRPQNLNPGTHTGKINVTTNDPKQPSVDLTVTITVQVEDVEEPINALVEQYTGTWCQWCPYGADSLAAVSARYGDRMVRTSWHDNDPMQISSWTAMNQWIGVSGFPTASVGRVSWTGDGELPISRDVWGAAVGVLTENFFSPVALTISNKNWDAATNTMNFKVTVFMHQGINADLRLTSILTEDDLNYAQKKYNLTTGTVETINPYYHKSVVRAIEPTDVKGLQLSTSNTFATQTTVEKTVSILAPSGFNSAKGNLVVYVHRLTDTQGPGPVQQAKAEPLTVTAADETPSVMGFRLKQNYPNPFNPTTTLSYDVPRESVVHIAVYDSFGRLLRTVADGTHAAGSYSIQLDGAGLASGTYFVTMRAGDFTQTRSMTLMK